MLSSLGATLTSEPSVAWRAIIVRWTSPVWDWCVIHKRDRDAQNGPGIEERGEM